MSDEVLVYNHTEAEALPGRDLHHWGMTAINGGACDVGEPLLLTLPANMNHRALLGCNLVLNALLQAHTPLGTSAPKGTCFTWTGMATYAPGAFQTLLPVAPSEPRTDAQRLLATIRQCSGLTYEEIAPLMGVSRRTLHLWAKAQPISAKRERRLRIVAEAVKAIAAVRPHATRAVLLDRAVDGLRPYDLLAEGLHQEAIDIVAGEHAFEPAPARRELESLAAQLDRRDDSVSVKRGRLRPGLSGRIR